MLTKQDEEKNHHSLPEKHSKAVNSEPKSQELDSKQRKEEKQCKDGHGVKVQHLNKQLLSAYYQQGTLLGAED